MVGGAVGCGRMCRPDRPNRPVLTWWLMLMSDELVLIRNPWRCVLGSPEHAVGALAVESMHQGSSPHRELDLGTTNQGWPPTSVCWIVWSVGSVGLAAPTMAVLGGTWNCSVTGKMPPGGKWYSVWPSELTTHVICSLLPLRFEVQLEQLDAASLQSVASVPLTQLAHSSKVHA